MAAACGGISAPGLTFSVIMKMRRAPWLSSMRRCVLATLFADSTLEVNSLHHQGIREPGPQLRIEARAADGLVEAVSLRHHPFALAVQWHPEWQPETTPGSQALFSGFIQAAIRYHRGKDDE